MLSNSNLNASTNIVSNEGPLEKSIIQNTGLDSGNQMIHSEMNGEENKQILDISQDKIAGAHMPEEKHKQRLAKVVDLKDITRNLKTYRTNRDKRAIREHSSRLENAKKSFESGSKKSQIADSELLKNNSELLIRDKKWTRFFFAKESPEMIAVKQSVAYLNNILDGDVVTTMQRGKEVVDAEHLITKVLPAYQTAFDACDKYIKVREAEGQKKGYGLRRLEKVRQMFKMIKKELGDMKLVIDNIQSSQQIGFTENEDILGEALLNNRRMSIRHLVGEVIRRKAMICEYVPEGNSSHTYRVKVEDEMGNTYYVKKEEPLLNENLPGYLDNRLKELKRSQKIRQDNVNNGRGQDYIKEMDEKISRIHKEVEDNKKSEIEADKEIIRIRAAREELRLEGILDEKDYELGIRLLEVMQNKINGLNGEEKIAQINRYIQFFAHDFDDFFARMHATNAAVAKLTQDAGQIDELIDSIRNGQQKGWETQVADLQKMKDKNLMQMNELQWVEAHKEELGISDGQGKELMDILKLLGNDQQDGQRISRLFQRTLGKEAELFGQQASRSGLSASDVLASNNTATSRLAVRFGFGDVVTKSFKSKLDFTEVGNIESSVHNVTFSDAAPGEELLQIMQDAQKLQKEQKLDKSIVHFSPRAIRELGRMQVFDLMTLQTDRHWRNIKAKVVKKEGQGGKPVWIIESLKCYDHDQSFGIKNLKEYFKDLKDPATGETKTVGEGFLKPIMMTVSKKSALYKYAKQTKMTDPEHIKAERGGYKGFLESIELPKSKTASLDAATKRYKARQNVEKPKDQYTKEPDMMTQRIISRFKWTKGLTGYFDDDDEMSVGKAMVEQSRTQKKIIDAMVKRNEGMKQQAERFFELMYELCKCTSVPKAKAIGTYDVVDTFLFDNDKQMKEEMKKLSKDEREKCMLRKDFIKKFKELVNLYDMMDFTHLEEDTGFHAPENYSGDTDAVGYYDYTFQSVFHLLKLKLQAEPEKTDKAIQELLKETADDKNEEYEREVVEEARREGKELTPKQKQEAIKKKREEDEADTVRVPAILHMDREAYQSIKDAYENEKELDLLLMDLEMTQDKKEALRKRLGQILEDAKEAEKIVNQWADKKGLPNNAIERKFLLDEQDYEKIHNITDMALDPGNSYYSVEDSQFMMDNEQMMKYIGTKEKEVARKVTNDERTTRRQKIGALGDDEKYTSYVNNSIEPVNDSAA